NTSAVISFPVRTRNHNFDPASVACTSWPDLLFSADAQEFTAIAPLRSGGFLLVGTGINGAGGQLHPVITQVFDFAAASFSRVGDAATRGTSHRTATPLSDAGVLLSGGFGRTVTGLSDVAERYDASAAQWRTVGSM